MPSEPGSQSGARPELAARLAALGALADPHRRELYLFVVAHGSPVRTDHAAKAVGVPRHVAKFHLDKLVAAGLLATEFHRPPGRSGPGAGRPAKHYRPAGEFAVSVPERHYDVAGELLARAVASAGKEGQPVLDRLSALAYDTGVAIGQGRASGQRRSLATLVEALADLGYEPRRRRGMLTLANCPFHHLAQMASDVVCTMNLEVIRGIIEGLGTAGAVAVLEPAPGTCCVRIRTGGQVRAPG